METIFALSFYSAGTKRTCLVDVTRQEENKRRLYGIGGIETVSKSKSVKLMAIALSVLLICGIFIWGITTDWGYSKNQRMSFAFTVGDEAKTGSYLLMVPKGASETNKVPCVIIAPGINSNAYFIKSYAIEFARRNYAVLSLDIPGSGQSEMYGNAGYAEGLDLMPYLTGIHSCVSGMNFVDQENVVAVGFSAGRDVATAYATSFPEDTKTAMHLSAYRTANSLEISELGVNYFGLAAGSSALNQIRKFMPEANYGDGWIGSGDWQEGTAVYGYINSKAVQHVFQPINTEMVENTIIALELSSPTDTDLATDDLVYLWIEIFAVLGFAALMVFLYNLVITLLSLDEFKSLVRETPTVKYPEYTTLIKNTKVANVLKIVLPVLNILFTCFMFEMLCLRHYILPPFKGVTSWAPSFFNGYIPFLILAMIWQLICFGLYHRFVGKPNGANAIGYGITWEGGKKVTAINLLKCLAIGAIVLIAMQTLSSFFDEVMGISFNFFAGIVVFTKLAFGTVKVMPLYFIIYIGVFACLSFGPMIIHKYADTGNEKKDAIVSDVIAVVFSALPFFMLAFWYLLYGMEIITVNPNNVYPSPPWVLMNGTFGYPFILSFIMPLNNRLYRKTKSIWPGVFVSAVIATVFLLSAYNLQTT